MLNLYNSTVWGIHNYYRFATHIAFDFGVNIHNATRFVLKNRLGKRLQKRGSTNNRYVLDHYGGSKGMRYLNKFPLCPISYVQTKAPLYKPNEVCKYTESGRAKIHENLKFDITVMLLLMREANTNKSIEFMDNRLSLWVAQYGKCAVTGKILWIDEVHCHHKIPLVDGGTDKYQNLVIVHKDIHILIHAIQPDTIQTYLKQINPTQTMLNKINKLRVMAGNAAI